MAEKLNREDIIKAVEEMSVLELNELVKAIEEKFGVSAAMPVQVAAAGPAGGEEEAKEDKDSFTVILSSVGDKKIQVIKVVRELTGLSLKEAKELVDGAPKPIKEGVKQNEAEEIKKKLVGAGAAAELK